MSDETEAIGILWKAGVAVMGIGGMIISFFTKRVVTDVDNLKRSESECKLDIANFRAEVARDYAKDASVQSSLSRIHDRLDDLGNELGRDIKTILTTMKR